MKNTNNRDIIVICLEKGFRFCPFMVGILPSKAPSLVVLARPIKIINSIPNITPPVKSRNNVCVATSKEFQNFIGLPIKNLISKVSLAYLSAAASAG
jgi:hypothetical protein